MSNTRVPLLDCPKCGGRHYGPATATNCPKFGTVESISPFKKSSLDDLKPKEKGFGYKRNIDTPYVAPVSSDDREKIDAERDAVFTAEQMAHIQKQSAAVKSGALSDLAGKKDFPQQSVDTHLKYPHTVGREGFKKAAKVADYHASKRAAAERVRSESLMQKSREYDRLLESTSKNSGGLFAGFKKNRMNKKLNRWVAENGSPVKMRQGAVDAQQNSRRWEGYRQALQSHVRDQEARERGAYEDGNWYTRRAMDSTARQFFAASRDVSKL